MNIKQKILVLTMFFLSANINAQSNKKYAIDINYGDADISYGIYLTKPINEKMAISLSGKNNSANNLNPIKLDFSYRPISKIPFNLYVGAGVELKRGKGYFTPLGVSYAINNLVVFAEISTYQGSSNEQVESGYWTTESVYIEDGYWEEYYVDYYYGGYWESYWVDTSYWDEQSVFNNTSTEGEIWKSKSSIFFGIRWYFK